MPLTKDTTHLLKFTYLNFLFQFCKMSTFNYTRERPAESTFSDIQSLNKFTDAVIVHI